MTPVLSRTAAALVLVLLSAVSAYAQYGTIAERRAGLTDAFTASCEADRKSDPVFKNLCACEARQRMALLSDDEVWRLIKGSKADRASMAPRVRDAGDRAFQICVAEWGYGTCMDNHKTEPKAEIYCRCMSESYGKAKIGDLVKRELADASQAQCRKRAGQPAKP